MNLSSGVADTIITRRRNRTQQAFFLESGNDSYVRYFGKQHGWTLAPGSFASSRCWVNRTVPEKNAFDFEEKINTSTNEAQVVTNFEALLPVQQQSRTAGLLCDYCVIQVDEAVSYMV